MDKTHSTEAAARADDAPNATWVFDLTTGIWYAPTTPCPDCDGRGTFIHPPGDFWYSSSLDWCGQCDGVGHVPAWDEA